MPASNAVSVVLLTSSLRRRWRYLCLAALASSSLWYTSPLRLVLLLRAK